MTDYITPEMWTVFENARYEATGRMPHDKARREALEAIAPLLIRVGMDRAAGIADTVKAAQMVVTMYLEPKDDPFPGPESAMAAMIRLLDGPEVLMAQSAVQIEGEPTCPGGPCDSYGTGRSKCEWPTCAIRTAAEEV